MHCCPQIPTANMKLDSPNLFDFVSMKTEFLSNPTFKTGAQTWPKSRALQNCLKIYAQASNSP